MGPRLLGRPGAGQHRRHIQFRLAGHIAAVVHRLGAIGTVLLAATGFDTEQRSKLHLITRIRHAVHLLGLPKQIHQGQIQQGLDLGAGPVVASDHWQRGHQERAAIKGGR